MGGLWQGSLPPIINPEGVKAGPGRRIAMGVGCHRQKREKKTLGRSEGKGLKVFLLQSNPHI